jgi:hypothetical protein
MPVNRRPRNWQGYSDVIKVRSCTIFRDTTGAGRGFQPVPQTGTLVHIEGYHRSKSFAARG